MDRLKELAAGWVDGVKCATKENVFNFFWHLHKLFNTKVFINDGRAWRFSLRVIW